MISGYNSAPSPAPYSPVSVFTRGRDSRYNNKYSNSYNSNYNSVPSAKPSGKVKPFVHSQHSTPLHRFNLNINYGK